ncbi:MAG: cytochrome b/b6 domain-containing protein [Alphaproteobacteria bacterium]|nr:cytochrome b/b6 domain-containing protein [Alphaproteobacteria bacterium]
MSINHLTSRYPLVIRILHWLIVLMLIIQFMPLYINQKELTDFQRQFIGMPTHFSLGVTIGLFMLLRVLIRSFSTSPTLPADFPVVFKIVARLVQTLLYILIIIMPIIGLLMMNAGGYSLNWWGSFEIPKIIGQDQELRHTLKEVHEANAFLILGLIGLHILGSFYHYFIRKDQVLKSMWFN